jgi:hypothetical protein
LTGLGDKTAVDGGSGGESLSLDTPHLEAQIRRQAVAALKRENTRDLVASMSSLLIENQNKVLIISY